MYCGSDKARKSKLSLASPLAFCYLCTRNTDNKAEIAQLVEHNLAKVGVASSSLVFRSTALEWWNR